MLSLSPGQPAGRGELRQHPGALPALAGHGRNRSLQLWEKSIPSPGQGAQPLQPLLTPLLPLLPLRLQVLWVETKLRSNILVEREQPMWGYLG